MVTGNCLWAISIHKSLQGVIRISSSAQILAQRQSPETIEIIVVGSSRQYTVLLLDYFFYDERQQHDSKSVDLIKSFIVLQKAEMNRILLATYTNTLLPLSNCSTMQLHRMSIQIKPFRVSYRILSWGGGSKIGSRMIASYESTLT